MYIGPFIVVFWLLPIVVGQLIGKPKNRAGWAWGLLLGWLGVVIVAVLGPAKETTLQDLEKQKNVMAPQYYEKKKAEILASRTHRECPHCKEEMRRDASVCPHCQRESPEWTFHDEHWWSSVDGTWYWLDEFTNTWKTVEEQPA